MFLLFAQDDLDESQVRAMEELYFDELYRELYAPSPLETLLHWGMGFAYTAFVIWMLVECLRKDPDRYLWMWAILLFPPFGPIIYFLVRWLPTNDLRAPKGVRRLFKSKELHRLEAAASQIGNAYHHIQLGDAQRDAEAYDAAAASYAKALAKEPENLLALWGAAQVDLHLKNFEPARERLQQILGIDPQYKFGDVSLAFGRTLCELKQVDDAIAHLEKHVKRWRQPEGLYLLSTLYVHRNRPDDARAQLQAMLIDIHGSPRAIARQQTMWKSRGEKLMRRLPK